MTTPEPRVAFEAFLRAVQGRDSAAVRALTHGDFVGIYPQSGERIRGVENMCAILDHYPGGYEDKGMDRLVGSEDRWVVTPAFTVLRVEGAGDTFTGVQKAVYPDGSEWRVVSIGEIRDGRVWRLETFFAPVFEPPAWRSEWVEVGQD